MAWDLWNSSSGCGQVSSGCNTNYWSQHPGCDFYFGCGRDVIEEDALNVASCVRVLRILITKADTEIEELERDLLLLQNELACADEREKWSDIKCRVAVTERINQVDEAVSTLKNDHADHAETQPPLDNGPAQTLHEMRTQSLDENILSPIMNVTEHALDDDSSTIVSNITVKDGEKQLHGTSESSGSLELLLELHEKRSDNPEKIEQLQDKYLVRSPESGAIICAPDHSDESKSSETSENKTRNEEVGRSQLINTDTGQMLDSFSAKDNGNIPNEVKKENEFVKEKDVNLDDFRPAIGVKGRKEYPRSRLATSQQQNSGPDLSGWMKLSEISDSKVAGNEEVGRSQLINADLGQILDLFSAKDNGNIPSEAKKENEFVKEDVSSDDFGPATEIKGRKKYPHSRLATSQQRKSRNSNLDKKLCDLAPKTARRAYKKQSKVAPDEESNSPDLPLQVVYPQSFCSDDTEFCSFKGNNGMQTKSALYTDLQLADEDEEQQEAEDLKSQITANLRNNMSFPLKLKAREKRKLELEAFSSREPYDSCTEVIPSTPIIVSTKRQRRSKPCTDVAILNEPTDRNINTRRAVQTDKHETEGRAIVLYDSKFSELQKRRKVSKLPITVDMETNSDSGSQLVLHTSKLHSHNGTPGDLSSLSLTDLRAMAKNHNVKQYYKLRKGDLVEELSKQLWSC